MALEIWQDPAVIVHSRIFLQSYHFWTGKELFPYIKNDNPFSEALYFAPFVAVSHNTEKDPVFNYCNLTAQKIWKMDWKDFTSMPSRFSAEPMQENRRNILLEEGRKRGITYLKKGIRINKEGQRFYIKDVVLFNLLDENKNYVGQGAVYENWEFI